VKLPSLVGQVAGPCVQTVDARWLMAYAAALGDAVPEYLDTTRPDGVLGHPLFPVCFEWPVALDFRDRLPGDVAVRSVHATHDLRVHRRPRPGDRLSTTASVVSTEPRSPGAYVVTRFETTDAAGQPVCSTDYGSIYLGVDCENASSVEAKASRAPDDLPPRARAPREVLQPDWSAHVSVPATLAHTYTECARIWNPIHTDIAVARSAGLPDIILHGTATLALAVSAALGKTGLGPGAEVTRITARFTGMVPLPSTLSVRGWDDATGEERRIAFEVLGADGRPVIRDGTLLARGTDGHRARAT